MTYNVFSGTLNPTHSLTQPPGVTQPLYSRGHNQTQTYNICPSFIKIGSMTAEKF